MPSLKKIYKEEIIPKMKEKLGYSNNFEVPKIDKIIVNVGVGSAVKDKKALEGIIMNVKKICGQAPIRTVAKKAISGFGIRENQIIGLKVTLRGIRMYEFLEKLINVVLPRIRDFQGLSIKSFDERGNYSIGLKEQIVFPEIKSDEIDNIHGLEICISTTAKEKKEAIELFKLFGFPLKDK